MFHSLFLFNTSNWLARIRGASFCTLRNLRQSIDLSDDCPLFVCLFWMKEEILSGSTQRKDSSVYGVPICLPSCRFSYGNVSEGTMSHRHVSGGWWEHESQHFSIWMPMRYVHCRCSLSYDSKKAGSSPDLGEHTPCQKMPWRGCRPALPTTLPSARPAALPTALPTARPRRCRTAHAWQLLSSQLCPYDYGFFYNIII